MNVQCCNVLQMRFFSQLLGWSSHETAINEIINKRIKFCYWPVFLMPVELLMAHLFRKTFFTSINLRRFSAAPLFYDLIYCGYFQSAGSEISAKALLAGSFIDSVFLARLRPDSGAVVHLRGGDFESQNLSLDGVEFVSYFHETMKLRVIPTKFLVVTDDEAYALSILDHINRGKPNIEFTISDGGLIEDFASLVCLDVAIGGESTFFSIARALGNVYFCNSSRRLTEVVVKG